MRTVTTKKSGFNRESLRYKLGPLAVDYDPMSILFGYPEKDQFVFISESDLKEIIFRWLDGDSAELIWKYYHATNKGSV